MTDLKRISILLILSALTFGTSMLHAQQTSDYDVVITRKGKRLSGAILSYEPGEKLHFRTLDGELLELDRSDFRRLTYSRSRQNFDASSVAASHSSGRLLLEAGYTLAEDPIQSRFIDSEDGPMAGYQIAVGYERTLRARLRVAGGAMLAGYTYERRERTVGLFGHGRYLLTRQPAGLRFFAQLGMGYELPIGSGDQPILDRKGGLATHPALGVEIGSGRASYPRLSLDVGYRFLKTSYRVTSPSGSELRSPRYSRLVFRAGISI